MLSINGLLAKMLILVIVVAIAALGASYTFVTIQQTRAFDENIVQMKATHQRSSRILFEQHLQELIVAAEEIVMLSGVDSKNEDELRTFFTGIWPRIERGLSLASMSFAGNNQRIEFGKFPYAQMHQTQSAVAQTQRPQSSILCHSLCQLSATIPVRVDNEVWALSLLTDISPPIVFLNSVVGSDIGIVASSQSTNNQNKTLSRYDVEVMTGNDNHNALFNLSMSDTQIAQLESYGMRFRTDNKDYFVWFETIDGIGQDLVLLFMRDISLLLEQQSNQQQQVIVILVSLTLGVLLLLILFSTIPISRLNQLKRVIKLIGAKEYTVARDRLGKPSKPYFNDELNDLEVEFRHAIDVLETYEQQLSSSQKRLVRQATIDATTGLFTRNVLIEDLGKMITDKSIHEVAIFFLDLDGFKPINDNLGHEAGDIMLKKIGYRLKGVVNQHIKVYRIGGDEFVICFCNYVSRDALGNMADSVVGLFAAPFHIYDTSISISASIGITMQDARDIDADQLLRYADIAMYQAKEGGKNRYEFFDDSMRDSAQQKFIVKNDFLISLASDQLFVVFQPIVCSSSRKVIKLETLCRWQHPELGFIAPPLFIDVLEESENLNVLFEWIIDNVIKEILYLDSIGRDDIVLSVNLSPSQLVNDDALNVIIKAIDAHRVSTSRIELEITETSLIANFPQAKSWVENATRAGFKIAIDDFGAGYSSLSYLTAFPYNTVKLDRSLLNKIDTDYRQQRIVGSITQMLHGLSVPIVAEGAETEEQFAQLKQLGCDYIQGFLISEPIPHYDLAIFLQNEEKYIAHL